MTRPSLRISVIALTVLFVVIADSALRIGSLGSLPHTYDAFRHIVAVPEIINAVIVAVVLLAFGSVIDQVALLALIAGVVTTSVHRWNVGSAFSGLHMILTALMFTVVVWLSVSIAKALLEPRTHSH